MAADETANLTLNMGSVFPKGGESDYLMIFDDDVLGMPVIDLFPEEIDSLVITMHAANLKGIDELDRQAKEGFQQAQWDSDEKAAELAWWEDEITLLRAHAGNMAMVSLVTLFDRWLIDFEKSGEARKIFPKKNDNKDGSTLLKRFNKIKQTLPVGPLSAAELEAIENARDSVIHHGAAAEFKNHRRGTIAIVEKFIADSSNGELRVAINMEILNTIANQIKQQANIWFREIQGKLK